MKQKRGYLIAVLLLGLTSMFSLVHAEQNDQQKPNVMILLDEMHPIGYYVRPIDAGYYIALLNDSVEVYLPYKGRVYQSDFSHEGLDMRKAIYGYSSHLNKKGRREINFCCKRNCVEYRFRVTLHPQGKAYVQLHPSNAQAISYSGDWEYGTAVPRRNRP